MKSPDSNIRRVALLIDTSTSWGVRIIRGIHQFAQQEDDWLFHIEPRGRYERLRLPQGWTGDGIIARVNHKGLADEIVASGIPTVNVSWYDFPGSRVARCTVSEIESGRMAAEYFLAGGFKNFGYCGPRRRPGYKDVFADEYRQTIQEAGCECDSFQATAKTPDNIAWDVQLASLVEWLGRLPKPSAVLSWSAARGRQVTEACHYAGIRVPDDIAVLGGDYDELMEDISNPPLSTIEQPSEKIGFEAARLLTRLMEGEPPPETPSLLSPSRVNVRHSTDTLAVDDSMVRSALKFIQKNATRDIRVGDVVDDLAIARRSLEQRFVRSLGRTPAEEIRRVRIEAAKQLLVDTNLTMAKIALQCGFGHQDLFSRIFRRFVGCTPTEYRRQHGSS
ncbi:MAG: substrate-binding domain-containing protein [Aeoliella sp.]